MHINGISHIVCWEKGHQFCRENMWLLGYGFYLGYGWILLKLLGLVAKMSVGGTSCNGMR